jgi:uncharacterized membrane protein HdeD (DUF308 family)
MTTATPTIDDLQRTSPETQAIRADVERRAARYWWSFLVSGAAWLLFALILFRFDYLTVGAIAVLFGVGAIAAAANEFLIAAAMRRGWRVAHFVLGLVFTAAGVIAIINPGGTFVALAAVMSFFLIFKGAFDIAAAFMTRSGSSSWWFGLLAGIVEVLLGFWAAGSWSVSAVVLVAWVGASAVLRGMTEIALAFQLRQERGAAPA